MTRYEFDKAFSPMTKALGIHSKVPCIQAEYYYEHYRAQHVSDFADACKYLARGNAGSLPKQSVFDDVVAAAKEVRLDREKVQDKKQADDWMKYGHRPQKGSSPMDVLWGVLCSKNVRLLVLATRGQAAVTPKQRKTIQEIEKAIARPDLIQSQNYWQTNDGLHPCDWLQRQVDTFKAKWPQETF